MTLVEGLSAAGGGLGALAAALRGAEAVQKRRKPPDSTRALLAVIETRLAKIEARSAQNREDIRRLFDRDPAPDLSDRVSRLEEDVRENAAAAAIRYDKILEGLGELRGTLLAFMKGDSIHDR